LQLALNATCSNGTCCNPTPCAAITETYCNTTVTSCGVMQTCGACKYGSCGTQSICTCNPEPWNDSHCGAGMPPNAWVCIDLSTTLLSPTCAMLNNGHWCCP
jgi:hypothetical protein